MTYLTREQERLSTPSMKCICGAKHSQLESACHFKCAWCGVVRESVENDGNGICIECTDKIECERCGKLKDAEDMATEEMCMDCAQARADHLYEMRREAGWK